MLAARPEHIKNSNNNYIFKHLNLKSNSYFNGGVLILNYRKWINEETFEKLQNTVANNKKICFGGIKTFLTKLWMVIFLN